jgi:trehalose 6-phosphate synthase
MALALQDALNMPLDERKHRHQQMLEALRRQDIHNWYTRFVYDLTGQRLRGVERAPAKAARPVIGPHRLPTH